MRPADEVREALSRTYRSYALGLVDEGPGQEVASPYEIGRQALDSGVGLIELISSHRQAERETALARDDAFMELVAPFEMVLLGYRETIGRLRQTNEDLEVFNHAIAHDLRNPVATIAMWASMARRRLEGRGGELAEFVDQIETVARHAIDLIADLLVYATLDKDDTPAEPVNLDGVLASVLASLAETIATSGASIESDKLPTLPGNRIRLEHVLQNLIDNAIKYRGVDRPQIRIDATLEGSMWTIRCRDNGMGVPAQERERIFTAFWRGAGGATPGGGLGLAICRRIVNRAGGRIWIEDSGPQGTTVAFALPRE
ncbi:MAG: ATP-binding protein [Candidatus Dormiibacterota bacterium]